MAAFVVSYDLPAVDQVEAYAKWAYAVTQETLLKQPGMVEVRAYRDPLLNSPHVMVLYEFDSLASAVQYMHSDVFKRIHGEATAHGCRNLSSRLLDTSPVLRGPVRPAS